MALQAIAFESREKATLMPARISSRKSKRRKGVAVLVSILGVAALGVWILLKTFQKTSCRCHPATAYPYASVVQPSALRKRGCGLKGLAVWRCLRLCASRLCALSIPRPLKTVITGSCVRSSIVGPQCHGHNLHSRFGAQVQDRSFRRQSTSNIRNPAV